MEGKEKETFSINVSSSKIDKETIQLLTDMCAALHLSCSQDLREIRNNHKLIEKLEWVEFKYVRGKLWT